MFRAVAGLLIVAGIVYYSPERDGADGLAAADTLSAGWRGMLGDASAEAAVAGLLLAKGLRDAPASQTVRVIPLAPPRPAGR